MMSGSEDVIKPDRHILAFVKTGLGGNFSPHDAANMVFESHGILKSKYPHLTPRLLDNIIWNYQRKLAKLSRNYKKMTACK